MSYATRRRAIRIYPTTRLGRIAGRLGLAFVGWFIVNQSLVGLRDEGVEIPEAARVAIIAWGLLGLGVGLVAGVLAGISIIRRGERSLLVYLATLPALFVLVLLLGELLVPH